MKRGAKRDIRHQKLMTDDAHNFYTTPGKLCGLPLSNLLRHKSLKLVYQALNAGKQHSELITLPQLQGLFRCDRSDMRTVPYPHRVQVHIGVIDAKKLKVRLSGGGEHAHFQAAIADKQLFVYGWQDRDPRRDVQLHHEVQAALRGKKVSDRVHLLVSRLGLSPI